MFHSGAVVFRVTGLLQGVCASASKWQIAMWLLNCWPDAADLIGHSSAITACSRGRQLQRALDVLESSQKLSLGSDEVLAGSLITASEKMARWDLALNVLCCLNRSANLVCHNAALSACEKASHWTWSLEILKLLKGRSLRPDATSFAALAEGCRRKSRWQVGLEVFGCMRRHRVLPGGRALSIQADMACAAQDARAYLSLCSGLVAMGLSDWTRISKGPLQDPDEGAPKRLADLAGRLRAMGVLHSDHNRQFLRNVVQPVLTEMMALFECNKPFSQPRPGVNMNGYPSMMSLVVSGLGAMEREVFSQVKMILKQGRGQHRQLQCKGGSVEANPSLLHEVYLKFKAQRRSAALSVNPRLGSTAKSAARALRIWDLEHG